MGGDYGGTDGGTRPQKNFAWGDAKASVPQQLLLLLDAPHLRAVRVPKIIKVGGIMTTFRRKQFCTVFWGHGVVSSYSVM